MESFAIGVLAILIVVLCWLYAASPRALEPFVFRRSVRLLRAARAAREILMEALASDKERI